MGLEHLGPYHQMPNHYLNDFGKLLKFRIVQLLHKQFINENKARKLRKKGVYGHLNTSESNQIVWGSCLVCNKMAWECHA